jgi:hypothetical protein
LQSADAISGRGLRAESFTVVFYGLKIFCCKMAQLCVTRRKYCTAETPSVSDTAQRSENTRKNSFLNYESPALTAELQARFLFTHLIMRIPDDQLRTPSGLLYPLSYRSAAHGRANIQYPMANVQYSAKQTKSAFRESRGVLVGREIRTLVMSSEVETSLDFSEVFSRDSAVPLGMTQLVIQISGLQIPLYTFGMK